MSAAVEIATNARQGELMAWERALSALGPALNDACRLLLRPCPTADATLHSAAPILAWSLRDDLDSDVPFATVRADWRARCAALAPGRIAFISTLLRHLPPESCVAMARLRRLDLLAAELSQEYGLLVLDIDRVLAHAGALALRTDAYLSGEAGQEAAAQVFYGGLLAYGLNDRLPDAQLDALIAAHDAARAGQLAALTVPVELVPRSATRVAGRSQVHLAVRPSFDERGLRGLFRDFRQGRAGAGLVAGTILRKIRTRLPSGRYRRN
jgi:hypothetical protein